MAEENKMGRPPKWNTPEELQAEIDKYFEDCKGEVLTDADGNTLAD